MTDPCALGPEPVDLCPGGWTRAHDLILEGAPPDQAVRGAASSPPPHFWPQPASGLNWLWLTALPAQAVVVDLGSPAAEFSYHARWSASAIHHLTSAPFADLSVSRLASVPHAVVSTNAEYPTALHPPSLIYLPALGRWSDRLPEELGTAGRLAEWAVDLLPRGGWFVALLPNPFYRPQGSPELFKRWARLRAKSQLLGVFRRSGFGQIHAYYLTGHPARPTAIVPATRNAVRAFLTVFHGGPSPSITLRSRIHATQFPSLLLMARR